METDAMDNKTRIPRFTAFNVLIFCVLSTCLIFLAVYSRVEMFIRPLHYIGKEMGANRTVFQMFNISPSLFSSSILSLSSSPVSTTPPPELSKFHIVEPGETIQAGDLEAHIATAVRYDTYPAKDGFNLFLNGWAKHDMNTEFKCCLVRTLPSGKLEEDVFVEVQAYKYHIYTQWIVDMQNAEFSCSISHKQLAAMTHTNFKHVTFTNESCYNAKPVVMEILHPKPVKNSVGVCLKITYGSLNPEQLVEWFEYTRMMGVTKVFTYYFDVDPPVYKVLEYYSKTGFLDLVLIHPAKSKNGPTRGFRRPRYEEQAWVDEVMAANDCKHRMAGFDYVIVMDMDEFIIPLGAQKSYYDVLKATQMKNPKAGCFMFDSYVVLLDWGINRKQGALHLTQRVQRTKVPNWDGADRNTRWAFTPNMTYWMQNNLCHARKGVDTIRVAPIFGQLWHFRSCKKWWKGCETRPRVNDTSLVAHESKLVDRILSLPLKDILYNNTDYVNNLVDWRRKRKP